MIRKTAEKIEKYARIPIKKCHGILFYGLLFMLGCMVYYNELKAHLIKFINYNVLLFSWRNRQRQEQIPNLYNSEPQPGKNTLLELYVSLYRSISYPFLKFLFSHNTRCSRSRSCKAHVTRHSIGISNGDCLVMHFSLWSHKNTTFKGAELHPPYEFCFYTNL